MDIAKTQALRDLLKDKSLLKEKCYINGAWVGGAASIDVTNPVDERVIAAVPKLGAKETREAIEGAEKAQKLWARKTAKERAAILRKWFNLMMENQEDLAQILTAEQGKPLAESRGEIAYGASFIEWFAERGPPRLWRDRAGAVPNGRAVVIKQAVGVIACITPWNFPNAMITRKAGAALAAGCAMVCKPAVETPLSALAMANSASAPASPQAVFSVITGSAREIGAEMTSNPIVRGSHLYGLDRDRPRADGAVSPHHQEARPRTGRQTRPSSFSTMPTSMRPWPEPWRRSTATTARPVSATTASTCRPAFMMPSPRSSPPRWAS